MDILIAEDEAVSRTLVKAVLETSGHRVTAVGDGREAWVSWQASKPRLIVSDWQMPVTDGLDLCRQVRGARTDSYTYFILLTGRTGRENFLEAMAAGVDDFMAKPVDAGELKARVQVAERILGLRQELHFLEGLLPICSYCKRIRSGESSWVPLERFVKEHTEVEFTHGICAQCYTEHVQPQLDELDVAGPAP